MKCSGRNCPGCSSPAAATSSASALTVSRWKLATRTALSTTTIARWRARSWLVTPVGHWPVWHCCAWMQPTANMKPRAALHQSAPSAITRAMSKPEVIARSTEPDAIAQSGADQGGMHEGQPVPQRHAKVIHELERGGAGAAFGAVDDNEIRGDIGLQHGLDDGQDFPGMANAELEAGGLAPRQAAQLGDEVQHFDRRRERRMAGGRNAVLASRHPANARDLLGDLGRRQHAAVPRFGPLAQFELHHLDLWALGHLGEGIGREAAVAAAAAEIAGADLPN